MAPLSDPPWHQRGGRRPWVQRQEERRARPRLRTRTAPRNVARRRHLRRGRERFASTGFRPHCLVLNFSFFFLLSVDTETESVKLAVTDATSCRLRPLRLARVQNWQFRFLLCLAILGALFRHLDPLQWHFRRIGCLF